MHFNTKSYLKSTCNHTAKHARSKPKKTPKQPHFIVFYMDEIFLFFIFIFYNHGLFFSYLICENDSFSM
jgi:hypothetical protein